MQRQGRKKLVAVVEGVTQLGSSSSAHTAEWVRVGSRSQFPLFTCDATLHAKLYHRLVTYSLSLVHAGLDSWVCRVLSQPWSRNKAIGPTVCLLKTSSGITRRHEISLARLAREGIRVW